MKRFFSISLIITAISLMVVSCMNQVHAQNVYQINMTAVCWTTPAAVDSNLYAYWLLSSREPEPRVVSYLDGAGQAVVVAGGSLQNGFCCCNGGGSQDTLGITINGDTLTLVQNGITYTFVGGSGADDDWRWVDPGAMKTMYEAVYRMGKTSIFTTDTAYAFRVDSTYRFDTDGGTSTLEWMRGDTLVNYKTLMFRAPGGTEGSTPTGANSITISNTEETAARDRLGAINFGGAFGVGDSVRIGVMLTAVDEGGGNDTTVTSLNVWARNAGETFMRNLFTFQGDGRLEMDRYNLFNDGVPERFLGYNNSSRDVTVHDVGGTPQPGYLFGINGFGTGITWINPAAISTWLKPQMESGNNVDILSGNRLRIENGSDDRVTITATGIEAIMGSGGEKTTLTGEGLSNPGNLLLNGDNNILVTSGGYVSTAQFGHSFTAPFSAFQGAPALRVQGNASNIPGRITMYERSSSGSNYIDFRAPITLAADISFELPATNGSNGQFLQTNGSGVTSWTSAPAAPTTLYSGNGLLASDRTVTCNNRLLRFDFSQIGTQVFSITKTRSGAPGQGYVDMLNLLCARTTGSGEGGRLNFTTDNPNEPLSCVASQMYGGGNDNREIAVQVYNRPGAVFQDGIRVRANTVDANGAFVRISDRYNLPNIVGGAGQFLTTDGANDASWAPLPDPSLANEGSLTVTAGSASTSVVNSNTTGSTPVTIEAGAGMVISESGNTITLSRASANYGQLFFNNFSAFADSIVLPTLVASPGIGNYVVEFPSGLAQGITRTDSSFTVANSVFYEFTYTVTYWQDGPAGSAFGAYVDVDGGFLPLSINQQTKPTDVANLSAVQTLSHTCILNINTTTPARLGLFGSSGVTVLNAVFTIKQL